MFKFRYWMFLFSSHSLFALTTLTVTKNTDNQPGDIGEVGDLRYCLNSMNQGLNTAPDNYEIVFDSPMTIQLNGILPLINNSAYSVNVTIGNPGSIPTVTIDGNSGAYSGFFIPTGNVVIQNMIFQNLAARGGDGGDGIAGGGGGLGAGGAIYAPQFFLNGSYPSITLINVSINNCSAIGGNGGNYLGSALGGEGGGGGGGFSGNGGSITTIGNTGGAGGGGFGGDGGNVTLSIDSFGGGGGGGGGLGSRATLGTLTNLGNGGSDQGTGLPGNGYGLSVTAGAGAGGLSGGNRAGGGGGGGGAEDPLVFGGGGGGSLGFNGAQPQGGIPPGGSVLPSGGKGGDGGGGAGGGIVITSIVNDVDGEGGSGGYGGGGGGGAGIGSSNVDYTVQGGSGGVGGGGGGGGSGGVNSSGATSAIGGNSLGGGGGGGGGFSSDSSASGGIDAGNLGGGFGGAGGNAFESGVGGGGGGGGSGLGAAIFVDNYLNLTLQAISGVPTFFNTSNNTTQAGMHGSAGSGGGSDGTDGSALGNSIFLRSGSSLTLLAQETDDLLTLGEQVSFVDDTVFGQGGTNVLVRGNGTVVYNGTSDYQGSVLINNAHFKVNGQIHTAPIYVCRNSGFSPQRGTLSGIGTLSGDVTVNSGIISPDAGGTLSLGALTLYPADTGALGSLVHIEINSEAASLVSVAGPASLAGILEISLDPNVTSGTYTLLTSSGLTGSFDFITFTGAVPDHYSISYLPLGNPTFVQFDFLNNPPPPPNRLNSPSNFKGKQRKNDFGLQYELYNQLTWTASSSLETTGYFIYRDGQKIAQVNALTLSYQDHHRKKGASYIYSITAFNSSGSESLPVNISVK